MVTGFIGKKVGMTQLYDQGGALVAATVVHAGPCVVVQRRTAKQDGYEAVQVGMVEARGSKGVTKPMQGHFKKAGVAPLRRLIEFRLSSPSELKAGDAISLDGFKVGDKVHVTSVSKGKGFQGVMKRHGFHGGAATHGSMFHRAPGSIGQSSFPSRVFPGVRMAGHMGARRVTTRNLTVVLVDAVKNLILIRGTVPGGQNAYVTIRHAGGA